MIKDIDFGAITIDDIPQKAKDVTRVMSFNLRYCDDEEGSVKNRSVISKAIIEQYSPDSVGVQEATTEWMETLDKELTSYAWVGVGRDDGATKGEYAPIFYKKSRVRCINHGTFWLSKTPDKPSKGWDAMFNRVCTYAVLKDKETGFTYAHFNAHFDHLGVIARQESVAVVTKKIAEIAPDMPVVMTGDFNVDQHNEIYSIIAKSGVLVDSYVVADKIFAPNGTFNAFNPQAWTDRRIDHIFVTAGLEVTNYAVLTDGYWTPNTKPAPEIKGNAAPQEISFRKHIHRCPSDHYPIAARIVLKK